MSISVTDLISKAIDNLGSGIRNYDAVRDDKSLLHTFHAAGRELHTITETLQTVRTHLNGRHLARNPQNHLGLLEACNAKAKLSTSIFRAVAKAPKAAKFSHYKAAVKDMGKGKTVEVLVMEMMEDLCACADNLAIQDQVKVLREAIKKLREMESSLPTEPRHTFTHHGSGDQYNTTGGIQNISRGDGNHFPGANFSGSVNFGPPTSH
ncbi:hypothetical protein QQS21_006425 [Conoideocrella luteorostrata]|uniref:NACHT-NTPase and P-loop NTPases N-terminal domain-containing protein n=1 Tax=Conoideocrella luteorostrata TaxID=1105319 RepID=A0AAJ0CML2_9HYPO|nr:hypothetical protein QQS21_006425 [Conoideocrella luteorostrata]